MKLKRLQIENIRSYKTLDISFNTGVSVVAGVNGSGKTSLLESCFIGLFGTSALSKEFNIEDILRIGAKNNKIILEFEQNGKNCIINREFSNGKTKSVTMRVDGKIIDGVNPIYDTVCKLLGMNEESYTNCVYVRQGEIDVLINARPKDRQRMIDDLLQIGKLEEYCERVKEALTGIGRQERDKKERIKGIAQEIEEIKSKEPLKQLKFENEQLDRIKNDINKLNSKKDDFRLKINSLEEEIKEYKKNEQQKERIEKEIKDINIKITSTQNEIEANRKKIHDIDDRISLCKQEISTYKTNLREIYGYSINTDDIGSNVQEVEGNEKEIYQLLNDIKNKRVLLENNRNTENSKIEGNKQKIQENEHSIIKINTKIKDLESNRQNYEDSIKELENNINQSKSIIRKEMEIDDVNVVIKNLEERELWFHGTLAEFSTKINELGIRIQNEKDLIKKGKCPTCNQSLKGSLIETEIKEHEAEKASLEMKYFAIKNEWIEFKEKKISIECEGKKIKENEDELKIIILKIDSNKKLIENYADQIKKLEFDSQNYSIKNKDSVLFIDNVKEKILSCMADEKNYATLHTNIQNKLGIIKKVEKNLIEIHNHQTTIVGLRNENKNKSEIKAIIEKQVYEKEDTIKEIETKLKASNINFLKSTLHNFKNGFAEIELDIKNQNSKKDKIISSIGAIREKLNRLDLLETNKKIFENKLIYINTVKGNAEELESMYMRLRIELRARSIGALDAYLNEMFSFMYSNNAYSHISLDSDYNLIIYEKDGTELEPKILSGGERAILNLVFRCAIYRLLSRETLPPLILDEPTVFLDKGHVNQLIKLIEMMSNRYGVEQILIVSHDETLLDSADHLYTVEKDPITNISSVKYLN